MQAGRELDLKVAELLGYTREERTIFDDGGTVDGYVIGGRWYSRIPCFSATWEDMGVLVEEAKKKGKNIDIMTFDSGYHTQVFDGNDSTKLIATASADSAPYAVCLAFLKAKEIAI
ncbi:hypothetical protein [Brevibacillus centrosporus]|uniref:hypothetical protein n=1 Tax=Brevibacillus centrosporus TaxID=54910 RepID=UPI002E1EEC35|nr:hypothetical protein [Brevibacillus centrosporus]